MNVERLKSFYISVKWPSLCLRPDELARDGFFYTSKGDIVKCAYCSVEIGQWGYDTNVKEEHKKAVPNCPMVTGTVEDNVPIDNVNVLAENDDDTDLENQDLRGTTFDSKAGVGVYPHEYSVFPNFSMHSKRLESFKTWPKSIKQKLQDMADVGFFYTGSGDAVICFKCGGMLRN